MGEIVCERRDGWDGNNWVDGGTGNSREGGGQWDGKQSGREQDALRRDGRRREQKPTTGRVGKSRSRTKNHVVCRSRRDFYRAYPWKVSSPYIEKPSSSCQGG